MYRRDFLKMIGLAGALSPFGKVSAKALDRPNILLLLTDDQRTNTIRALGNREIITPNMDKLVRGGTSFSNAYILGSPSAAVCAPSRAMLLTGRSYFDLPTSVNVPWSVPDDERGNCPFTTLPETLRDAGYATFGTGKWHNGPKLFAKGFTHGGAIFFGGMGDHYRLPLYDFEPSGVYPSPSAMKEFSKTKKEGPAAKHSTESFVDASVDFLRNFEGDAPFFMYVAFTAPHDPRTAPQVNREMYDPERLALPKNFLPEHPFDNGEMKVRDEKLAKWPRTPAEVKKHIADYYAMITHVDDQIGRILDELSQMGELDNTIIVFAGDNGLALGQHGLMGKQSLYEHSIRVPLVFCAPGVPKGQRAETLCYLHDIFPTLCEMVGVDIPSSVQSKSLSPALANTQEKTRQTLAFAYRNIQRASRDNRYKLIIHFVKGQETQQLFDLLEDPYEMNNLADDPAHAKHLARLGSLLLPF